MTTPIPAVTNTNNVTHFITIDLTLGSTTYYISTNRRPLTLNGNYYQALGWALNIDNITDDLKTNNGDMAISLSGIPDNLVDNVLTNNVKGGSVLIRRWFSKDNEYSATQTFEGYLRYKGVVTNFVIQEDDNFFEHSRTYTCTITTANINTLMENRVSGQRSNASDRKRFYPGDISFDRVKDLMNISFDFGRKFTGGTGYGGTGFGAGGGFGGFGGGGGGGGFLDNINVNAN